MKNRNIIASGFIVIALALGTIFLSEIVFPVGLEDYLKKDYYNQFGPLAIGIELLIAGIYLFLGHSKANFTLALFAFTALLDPFFNMVGLFTSLVPLSAMGLFFCCALLALWLAFSNAFGLGRISFLGAFGSFILGVVIELFFNAL